MQGQEMLSLSNVGSGSGDSEPHHIVNNNKLGFAGDLPYNGYFLNSFIFKNFEPFLKINFHNMVMDMAEPFHFCEYLFKILG